MEDVVFASPDFRMAASYAQNIEFEILSRKCPHLASIKPPNSLVLRIDQEVPRGVFMDENIYGILHFVPVTTITGVWTREHFIEKTTTKEGMVQISIQKDDFTLSNWTEYKSRDPPACSGEYVATVVPRESPFFGKVETSVYDDRKETELTKVAKRLDRKSILGQKFKLVYL
jgi:hypothetical protein